jgi:hypothetical protein
VLDIRDEIGELSFEARIGDRRERVWMRTDAERPTSAEAVLPVCLMPAMRFGGTLELPVPISPRLLRSQREYQGIQRAWSLGWTFGNPPLLEVEVRAPAAEPQPARGAGRVAAFFSAGVDSWSILLDHPEITDLIFVQGIDLLLDAPHQQALSTQVEARLRSVADELGLEFHVVETNLRQLIDPLAPWITYFGCALAAVSLFLAPRFERVLIAGSVDYEVQGQFGGTRLVDQLWSTEQLEIVECGGRFSRVERTAKVASDPIAQRSLRVCWENQGGAYNCGRCRKCLMTMLTLEAVGARDAVTTFPPELDLDAIGSIDMPEVISLNLWEDVLDAVRDAGRVDLETPVEAVVEDGKRQLGLPPGYRRRSLPGPPALGPAAAASNGSPSSELSDGEARALLEAVLESRSWRLTRPLRRLGSRLRRAGS